MTMNGIDISSWQAGIDIPKLTTTQFVIVKATGGIGYSNPYFISQLQASLAGGKLGGAYHYARETGYKGTAKAEAALFYDRVKNYIGKIILALDWEAELSLGPAWALEWLDEVYRLTGIKPLLYTSQSECVSHDWTAVANAGYKLWLAQYANNNPTGYQSDPWQKGSVGAFGGYVMHQYTGTGRLTGYSGNLDLNLFYGGAAGWAALAGADTSGGEEGDMDISKLTEEQCYEILQKAQNYAASLPVPDWAAEELGQAIEDGITDGSNPAALATRAEAAIMAERALNASFAIEENIVL